MILDGYGLSEKTEHNAVALANKPVMNRLMSEFPFVKGNASGLAVGLPDGQMGNSEVGHMNMGAGRIIYQEFTRISKSIEDGDFFENEALLHAVEHAAENHSSLHFMGLVSDGGVHSHITHIYGLLKLAKEHGLEDVFVHCEEIFYIIVSLQQYREDAVGFFAGFGGNAFGHFFLDHTCADRDTILVVEYAEEYL